MLGLLGGTFDPVHRGHLDVAHAARRALELESVWLIPARVPPHRTPPQASAAHRFAMTAMAVADEDGLLVSDLEMDEPGPSYTTDTLDRIERRGIDPRTVCLIMGADAFRDIRTWKAYPTLLDRCHVAVVSRPGARVADLPRLLPDLAGRMQTDVSAPGAPPAIHLVDADTAAVSSTDVRQAIAGGRLPRNVVPVAVGAHIERHGLYREAAGPASPPREFV